MGYLQRLQQALQGKEHVDFSPFRVAMFNFLMEHHLIDELDVDQHMQTRILQTAEGAIQGRSESNEKGIPRG